MNQENNSPNPSDPLTLSPNDLEFAISEKDLFHYLSQIRPDGYECPLCGGAKWGAVVSGRVQDNVERVYPTSLPQETYRSSTKQNRMYLGARGNYELLCVNCGHVIGFNAGMVASRLAVWKKAGDNE